ncbi:Crp/Fnr family transcriptional regulator [Pseudomonas fluorescens]|uniref:Crp/Fnr family transcriptional regulator n=1 Tax=Pseudomonas fluorescens TaxID=294 RepID=A0A327MQP5_PSEFL|nr:Crp/Fnr family transcriptional regulator [Pseudomonas fluorescens]RAI64769.1 Crp/Fnr family transcriptional regulator [Pseudomonas fluorescens]
MKTAEELLQRTPWFLQLTLSLQENLLRDVSLRAVEPDEHVCRRGQPSQFWFGVVDGLLKVCNTSWEGRPMTFAGLPAGAWFGEGTVLKGEHWHYDAVAVRTSLIACVPSTLFFSMLETSIPFNRFLLEHINERLGQIMATVQHDRLAEPTLRVANCLLALFNPKLYPLGDTEIALTQEEIGYLSGVTRQKVNIAIRKMHAQELITLSYGRVKVTNLEGLHLFAASQS